MMNAFLEPLESRERRRSDLSKALKSLIGRRDSLERAIADHQNFNPQQCVAEVSQLCLDKDRLSNSLAEAEAALRSNVAEIRRLEEETVNPLWIITYYSDRQKILRSKISNISGRIAEYQESIRRLEGDIGMNIDAIERKSRKITSFHNFDASASDGELRSIFAEIELTSRSIALLDGEIAGINRRIGSLVAEYKGFQTKVHALKMKISAVDGLDRELSNAGNGYERAKIHEGCETRFGHGSPKKVRADASRELRLIENNLPKIERRIRDELKKSDMVVSHIIIDGNNTCYDRSNFIRLHALTHLVDELVKKYRVTVVFDASIRGLMKADDAAIERIIGRSAAIHVAPTRTGADEFILRLADGQPEVYVLSNDRFGEFGDYDAVKSGRLLRFLIADNRIMLNDLDMVVELRS